MAYTVSDIHARQIEVFHQLQDNWNCNNASSIKNALIITQYDASHKYVKFIGLDVYEDAGGEVIKDLFAEEEKDVYLCNDALVEKLVDEKLNEEIAKLSDKWKWVESRLELDWDERYSFKHLSRQKLEEIPHDLILKKEELEEKVSILEDEEEYDQNVVDKLQAQLDDYDAKIKAYYGFVEKEMANAGCIITISYDGELEILEGLIKPEDFKKQNIDSGKSDSVKAKPFYSKPLTQRLENYRLHSIKMDLANDYEASFDVALFNMCIDIFGKYERKCLDLSASEYYYPFSLKDGDKTCNDMQAVEDKFYKKLPLDWMQEDSTTDKFNSMCKLSIEEKQNLFSSCVSKTLKPQLANDKSGSEMFEVIGERLSVDVAKDFTPTATNYFKHISKGELLQQGNELLGEKWMNLHIKKTKSELVNIMDKIFTNPKHHKLASDVLEKVKTWLPKNMSF